MSSREVRDFCLARVKSFLPISMPGAAVQEQPRQNTTTHYLRKERLEARLRELFPDVKDFKIRMQNDEYSFVAPRRVEAIELVPARVVTESDEE